MGLPLGKVVSILNSARCDTLLSDVEDGTETFKSYTHGSKIYHLLTFHDGCIRCVDQRSCILITIFEPSNQHIIF